jgi:hypothetical protein
MANVKPLRYARSGSDTVGLSELQTTETIAFADIEAHDHTGVYQVVLESGINIKTINNSSILGSGNLTIEGGSGGAGETFSPFLLAGM